MSKNMAALWNKLESLQPVRRDGDPTQAPSSPYDRSSELPIVPDIGNRPEEWLTYTRCLRKQNLGFPDTDSRHNFLCGAYDKAIKMMPATDNKRNISYAMFLIEYAKIKREYSPDDTRALFNHARVYSWRFAFVHVAAAEFELQSAHPSKCKKILEKGKGCDAQPSSMLQMALRRFTEGRSVLMTDEEMEAYYISVAGSGKSGSTSSQDSTGDLSFSGSIQGGRAPLLPLSRFVDHKCKGPAVRKDSPSGHSIITFKAERDENRVDNRCVFESKPSTENALTEPMEVTEANTAPNPVADILGVKPCPRAPLPAPASCSKPPFRSYHSTPDVKNLKTENEQKNHSQAAKWLPRRVKKLDLPLATLEDESSEDDEASFNDIKPLDESTEPVITFESMDQSHPGLTAGHISGHTSGYGSSVSMTSYTRGYPTPAPDPPKVHRHSPILEVDCAGEGRGQSVPMMGIEAAPGVSSMPCVQSATRDDLAPAVRNQPVAVSTVQSNPVHLSCENSKPVIAANKINCVEKKPNPPCSARLNSNSTYDLNPIVPSNGAIPSRTDVKPRCSVSNEPKSNISQCVPPVMALRGGSVSRSASQSSPSHAPQPNQSAAQSLPRPQLQQMNRTTTLPSQPVCATPSQSGGISHHVPQPAPPPVVMYTPNMKAIEEIIVNGKHYSVLRVVGRGGSSKVYQCFDFENKKSVGIKCVDLSEADEFVIQGYKNEITLLKQLQHSDKVIKMFDYEHNQDRGCLYIVMELGDTDLASLFRNASKTKDITESLMKYYWEAMLKAVKVLHQQGIIHSDLKPANFLLVQGQLKLIDFGIANAIQQDRTSVMRETQVGTLNYMSPEAIMESCGELSGDGRLKPKYKIGVKCDVWSLGCILYNMVYGHTPFQLITKPFIKYHAIINPSHQIDFPDIADKHLLDVMKRCLIRDVKQRPTIDELLDHPYLNRTKAVAAPSSMHSLLVELQQAVANSPGKIKHLEKVLNSFKEGSSQQETRPHT